VFLCNTLLATFTTDSINEICAHIRFYPANTRTVQSYAPSWFCSNLRRIKWFPEKCVHGEGENCWEDGDDRHQRHLYALDETSFAQNSTFMLSNDRFDKILSLEKRIRQNCIKGKVLEVASV